MMVKAGNTDMYMMPQEGGLMGRSEAPRVFAEVFKRPVASWMNGQGRHERQFLLQGPNDKKSVGTLVGFADDLFKKHIVHTWTATKATPKAKLVGWPNAVGITCVGTGLPGAGLPLLTVPG